MDDYQGQEHRYLFISTVLTRPESLPGQLTLGRFANRAGGADSKASLASHSHALWHKTQSGWRAAGSQ